MEKRKTASRVIIDETDLNILSILNTSVPMTITSLKNKIRLTHANLLTHLKRLSFFINLKRNKQKKLINLNKHGKNFYLNLIDFRHRRKLLWADFGR